MAPKEPLLPEEFETQWEAEDEAQYRIKILEQRSTTMSLGLCDLLKECMEDDMKCNSPACPICSRERRLWLIPAVVDMAEQYGIEDLVVVTLIFYSDAMSSKQLNEFALQKLNNRMIKQFKRLGIVGPVIGGFELDYHVESKRWIPHSHLLMPKQEKALKKLRAYMKRDKNMATRLAVKSRPMVIQKLKDPVEQISYLFKFYWSRVESYRSSSKGKRYTEKYRLKNKQLALSLRTKRRFGFSNMLFIYGARIAKHRVIVSGK